MGLVPIFTLGIPRLYQIDNLLKTETQIAGLVGIETVRGKLGQPIAILRLDGGYLSQETLLATIPASARCVCHHQSIQC